MKAAIGTFVLLGWIGFAAPPIKMGLWEITTSSTTRGTGQMADALAKSGKPAGVPQTQTTKVCITPETWEKAIGQAPPSPACTKTNVVSTAQKLSMKLSCTYGSSTMVSEMTTLIDNPGQIHGTVHLTAGSAAGAGVTDGTTTAKFLSSDCGDVKPIGTINRRLPQ